MRKLIISLFRKNIGPSAYKIGTDLLNNSETWFFGRHTIEKNNLNIWVSNGPYFVDIYPRVPGVFNFVERVFIFNCYKEASLLKAINELEKKPESLKKIKFVENLNKI